MYINLLSFNLAKVTYFNSRFIDSLWFFETIMSSDNKYNSMPSFLISMLKNITLSVAKWLEQGYLYMFDLQQFDSKQRLPTPPHTHSMFFLFAVRKLCEFASVYFTLNLINFNHYFFRFFFWLSSILSSSETPIIYV